MLQAQSLFDLGMGTGKLALQAFLQFPNLGRVVGIELATSRFVLGEKALINLANKHPKDYVIVSHTASQEITVADLRRFDRRIQFRRENLFEARDARSGDIIILQTNFPAVALSPLCLLLSSLKDGALVLTYLNLMPLWTRGSSILHQLEVNRPQSDRFATSWSLHRGCHFFLWEKGSRDMFGKLHVVAKER